MYTPVSLLFNIECRFIFTTRWPTLSDMSYAPTLFTVRDTGSNCTFWLVDAFGNQGIESLPLDATSVLMGGTTVAVTNSSYNSQVSVTKFFY
jgi:hypothetical protein